ncbi:hypothetical protein AX14_006418 [Amanita brunnescens Koide BX004]|nr:hypothetical protein AX14_006418 [Amanita brunnescens Koide BX004]
MQVLFIKKKKKTDLFQFDSIAGTRSNFICLLIGLARSWDDDAECNPAGIVKTLINNASSLVKTEEELHIAQTALSRIRNECNQAMTDVRKLVDTVDRLRKDRNTLKAAMEDIVGKGGVALSAAQFEGIQAELAQLKDENDRLNKVIKHDKDALRTAEEENTAFTLQISLMNEDFDDKNAVIEALEATCNGRTGRTHIDQVHVCIYTPQRWGAIALAPIHACFPF